MTITLDVAPQVEERVRRVAKRKGVQISDYILDVLETHLEQVDQSSITESELLQQINLGLSDGTTGLNISSGVASA